MLILSKGCVVGTVSFGPWELQTATLLDASVHLGEVINTSGMGTLKLQNAMRFWNNICCLQGNIHIHFSTRQYKTTFCTHYKGMAEEKVGTGTRLAHLFHCFVSSMPDHLFERTFQSQKKFKA